MSENLHVQIHDTFWNALRETARTEGIPYQWRALNDQVQGAEPSYCMRNFHAAAGKVQAPHAGFVFQDSDVAKWLEAVAYSLRWHPDAELEKTADRAIEDILAAQQPDGYMDTYYILTGLDKRWTNLTDYHELYCAGHMIEAAVAYYQTTGKRALLDAVIRLTEHIAGVIGDAPGQIHGYPGHPVIEMALVKLYRVTGDPAHLRLAEYFIRQRGQSPLFFRQEIDRNRDGKNFWDDGPLGLRYYQADKPLTEQTDAEGHAVRALYLYSGLADVALLTNDRTLKDAAKRLWDSVVNRQMYITGAVGSSEYGEAFTFDYDLPNDTVYGESCAAIALVFFAARMLRLHKDARYADVMERALYNGVISGMQLDGKRFFYVNPLEVDPKACQLDAHKRHVKAQRQPWFSCACCPPNIIRLLMSLQDYIATADEEGIFLHLYTACRIDLHTSVGDLTLNVDTRYPWNGHVQLQVLQAPKQPVLLAMRQPGWCGRMIVTVNDQPEEIELRNGYVLLKQLWQPGDRITLDIPMEVKLYRAHNAVKEDIGKRAVMRGPIVYCLEEVDNGSDLHLLRLGNTHATDFTASFEPNLLGGVIRLTCPGMRQQKEGQEQSLYLEESQMAHEEPVRLTWIPYYAWANRDIGEMSVWIRR